MINYTDFRGLRQTPFEAIADPDFFYESQAHGEALARLLYFAGDRGMGLAVLTGEIGAGKTITLSALKRRLSPDLNIVVEARNADLSFDDILRHLNAGIRGGEGGPGAADRYGLLQEFQRLARERIVRYGRHCLLIIDEAQMLAPETLDGLRTLTNYNEPGRAALSIVLAGQPEMKETLRGLPQVFQRVGLLYHLAWLRRDEILPYLQRRLTAAGATGPGAFEEGCLEPLFLFSRGCPRQINRICKLAVDRACLLKEPAIRADLVALIISDFERHYG